MPKKREKEAKGKRKYVRNWQVHVASVSLVNGFQSNYSENKNRISAQCGYRESEREAERETRILI